MRQPCLGRTLAPLSNEGRLAVSSRALFGAITSALLTLTLLALASPAASQSGRAGEAATGPSPERLVILVPAPRGGGLDQTANAMKQALEGEGLVREAVIEWRPGGGGLVALAEVVEARRGDPRFLILGGSVMVTASQTNQSVRSLLDTTPIARLAGDYQALAVPPGSPIRDLDHLLQIVDRDPSAIHWTSGSDRGRQLVERIYVHTGVDAASAPFELQAGDSDARLALRGRDARLVAISSYGALAADAAQGYARILAVAAPGRQFRGLPTLEGHGFALSSMNWRGVFAPPAIPEADARRLEAIMSQMVRSRVWRQALDDHGWVDLYLSGAPLRSFVLQEHQRPPPDPSTPRRGADANRLRDFLAAMGIAAALALAATFAIQMWRRRRPRRREQAVKAGLASIPSLEPSSDRVGAQQALVTAINREFESWKLSDAERDVAWLMLKGLAMREIARLRGTSERTVNQQAQAVYGKSGLEGRTDLAGYILDQCLAPQGSDQKPTSA